jgi:hypothetical protein
MKKILIATRPQNQESISLKLSAEFDLVNCTSLKEAAAALDGNIHLIACGVHFGESEMYDFLKYAKMHPIGRSIPFLCVYGSKNGLSPAIRRGIEIATNALGAEGFIDLTLWREQFGDEVAESKMLALMKQFAQVP